MKGSGMDARMVRALLELANMSADKPKDAEWCADFGKLDDTARESGVRCSVRFWLVSNDSGFMQDDTLIWAGQVATA